MIKFTDDLLVGVGNIDEQHKELFERINAVTALGAKSVSKEVTDKTIKMLGDYIIKHFRDEELLHRQYGYPKADKHKDMHTAYIESYKKLVAEYNANGPSAAFTLQLNKSIVEWIVKHIRSADADFGKFVKAK
ncbi:MAG: bacteriohemerythrin [Defluviitaleaceae bacterium]|nr:bacteriohemerythrin [Defluviitaleaceae bacterium]